MGLFLNPDDVQLRDDRCNPFYIDKSLIISELNKLLETDDNNVCVSRPRRFGKTLAANMLAAYYTKGVDSHDAFKGLKIESDSSFEEYINKYNVLKLDAISFYYGRIKGQSSMEKLISLVIPEFREQFTDLVFPDTCNIAQAIRTVYEEKKEQFVIIIDEYDVMVRENDREEMEPYLNFLNGLFKNSNLAPAIALSYVTGILPVIKCEVQSKLNNFIERSMLDAGSFAPFMGFTKDEVRILAEKNGMDMAELERWYDGYCVDGVELYSPKSVIEALKKRNAATIGRQQAHTMP